MAKLPDVTDLGARQAPGSIGPARAPASRAGQSTSLVGESLSNIGEFLAKEQDNQNKLVANDATNQLRRKQIDLSIGEDGFSNKRGKDGLNVFPEYMQRLDSTIQAMSSSFQNDEQRRLFKQNADIVKTEMQQDILVHQTKQKDVYANQAYEDGISVEIANATARWNDPNGIALSRERIDYLIRNQADRLGWSEDTINVQRSSAHGKIDEIVFASQAQSLTDELRNKYGSNLSAALSETAQLPGKLRSETESRLKAEWDRERAIENDAYQRRERVRKEYGETALKEAYNLLDAGMLTRQYIESNREFLSPSDYGALIDSLRGGTKRDDAETVADLQRKKDDMEPDAYEREAYLALKDGRVTTQTYRSMTDQNRSIYADKSPANPYKSARERIKTTLDPGQLLSGAASQIARASQASALVEYDLWAEANPNADRAAALEQAEDIVRRNQVVPFEQMKLALGVPKYVSVSTREAVTLKNIEEAENKLADDIEANRLSEAQAVQQIRLLKDWRTILEREGKNGQ